MGGDGDGPKGAILGLLDVELDEVVLVECRQLMLNPGDVDDELLFPAAEIARQKRERGAERAGLAAATATVDGAREREAPANPGTWQDRRRGGRFSVS